MRNVPLQVKVVSIVFAILIIAYAVAVIFTIGTQRSNLLKASREKLVSYTQILTQVLRNIMIAGSSDVMSDTLRDLRGLDDFESIAIFSQDAREVFLPPAQEAGGGDASALEGSPELQEVISSGEPRVMEFSDTREMAYFFPIPNEPSCHECHGSDHSVRGVEYFRISFLNTYNAINRSSLILVVFLVGLAVISGSLLVLFVHRAIIAPILSLYSLANRLREGDLTGQIEVRSGDEIGVLSLRFRDFVSSFRDILLKIKTETARTNEAGTSLAASSGRSIRELDNIRGSIGEMRRTVSTLDGEVGSSGQSAANVNEYIVDVVERIAEQSGYIEQSSAAIEQISVSIRNLAGLSEKRQKVAERLGLDAQTGQAEMRETVEVTRNAAASVSLIMEMLEVIDNIAAETGLLAINAAIEAAHSGEAGKGFAVVANQIRALADSSASSAKEMAESLKNMTGYIRRSEEAAGRTMEILTEIFRQIGEMIEGMHEMRNANSELDQAAQQILQSLAALKEFTGSVKESSENMGERARDIVGSMEALGSVSGRAKSGMDEITASIEGILEAAQEVSDTGEKNLREVKELENLVGKFKID